MTTTTHRILPFLAASVALHFIAIGALGGQSLQIASSPDGTGRSVSIRLEAAAPSPDRTSGADQAESPRAKNESTNDPRTGPTGHAWADAGPTTSTHAQHPDTANAETSVTRAEQPGKAAAEPEREMTRNAGKAETTATEQFRRPEAPSTPAPHGERVARTDRPAGGSADTSSRASRSEARKAIVAQLAKHFRYPRLAQRRGWEGTVVLAVRILPDGRLDGIRVKGSSGRALLDRSAREALGRVKRLPQFADRLGGSGLALEIPVIYRLESA